MNRKALLTFALLTACSDMTAGGDLALAENGPAFASITQGGEFYRVDDTLNADDSRSTDRSQDTDTRKLIRTGSISVQVDSYGPFESALNSWLASNGGQITSENVSHSAGDVGWSSLVLRVPSDDLDPLTSWLEETVEVTHLSVNTEDVTRTWVDLAARLENAQRTEGRLLSLLETDAESLTDVLAVERELSRVRGDIESMEAQKRSLDGQIAMSTLSVDVTVRAPYQSVVSASLPDRLAGAFTGSIATMGDVGEAALLAGVAASPWLLLFGGGLWGLSVVRRRRRVAA